jgi:cysteine desulfurase
LREHFGNPASRSHACGWEAEEAVEQAREHVAALIGADPTRDRLDLRRDRVDRPRAQGRGALLQGPRGKHLVTVKTEHKAALDTMRELERAGLRGHLPRRRSEDGLLDLDAFQRRAAPGHHPRRRSCS